jgi:hypothetical protein
VSQRNPANAPVLGLAQGHTVLPALVLADKAYAGALGEGEQPVRPVKRGERAYLGSP